MDRMTAELTDLYRQAAEASVEEFPLRVLGQLRRWIDFDGAVFGFGAGDAPDGAGLRVAQACVHQRDPAILAEYREISAADPLTEAFLHRPGRPLRADARLLYARNPLVGEFAARHDLRHLLLHGDTPDGGTLRWAVLYRGIGDGFGPHQAEKLRAAWPHVGCALELNQALALDREEARRPSRALALVDAAGLIRICDPAFLALLSAEWPHADTHALPAPARAALASDGSYRGRAIELQLRTLGSYAICRARRRDALSTLSAREREVAILFTRGHNHKEVGRLLAISPNTVRAQLAQIYRKLGINDKATLARRLEAEQGTGTSAAETPAAASQVLSPALSSVPKSSPH